MYTKSLCFGIKILILVWISSSSYVGFIKMSLSILITNLLIPSALSESLNSVFKWDYLDLHDTLGIFTNCLIHIALANLDNQVSFTFYHKSNQVNDYLALFSF